MTGSSYNELLVKFNPRIIHSEEEYKAIEAILDPLIAKYTLTKDERDFLFLLEMLLERYDEENDVFPELRGVALIRALLEDEGLRQKDLVNIFKSESIVSEVLNGNRKMMAEHIDGLAKMFNLPQSVFFEGNTVSNEPIRSVEADKPDDDFGKIEIPGFHDQEFMTWHVADEMASC